MDLKSGQRIDFKYQGRLLEVVVINPHAFGYNRPSIGLNYRMQERCAGLQHSTVSHWVKNTRFSNSEEFSNSDIVEYLELPKSKKKYIVYHLPFDDKDQKSNMKNLINGYYKVIEASDFIELCFDVLAFEKISTENKFKIKDFLQWFTIEGFYAQIYVLIKGSFSKTDSEELCKWLWTRFQNKPERKSYTRFLVELRENPALWTDFTYLHLFGKIASEMRKCWKTISGLSTIARNHIPEAMGLEAVGFVERIVCDIYTGDLFESHNQAIKIAQNKFNLTPPENIDLEKLYSRATRKLNPTEIKEILELYQTGEYTQSQIAEAYNVTQGTISYHIQATTKN